MLHLTFIVITLLALIFFYYGTGEAKKILQVTILWLFIAGGMAYSGFFENASAQPPRFLFVLVAAGGLSVYLYKTVNLLKIRPGFLLAVHTLRLPVEMALYQLFLLKQVPILMTYKGWNFDISMGISAICILFYLLFTKGKLHKYFILLWNITGLFFLTFIVVIAILSSPLPIQQLAFDQPNIAVLQFPFIYLPAFIVPVVFLSHIFMMKKQAHQESTTANKV